MAFTQHCLHAATPQRNLLSHQPLVSHMRPCLRLCAEHPSCDEYSTKLISHAMHVMISLEPYVCLLPMMPSWVIRGQHVLSRWSCRGMRRPGSLCPFDSPCFECSNAQMIRFSSSSLTSPFLFRARARLTFSTRSFGMTTMNRSIAAKETWRDSWLQGAGHSDGCCCTQKNTKSMCKSAHVLSV